MPTITLIFAGVAALVNMWLAIRCGRVRTSAKIMHGDGGNPLLQRRMRAHLNFAENTPLVLILTLALELAGTPTLWLAIAAALFIIARVCHGIGMDAEQPSRLRGIGVAGTMLVTLALLSLALVTGYRQLQSTEAPPAMAQV